MLAAADLIHEKRPDLPVRLDTNGLADLIWKRDTVSQMAGRINRMNISLNASNEAEYLRITHACFGEGSYEAMLKFARHAARVAEVTVSVVDCIGEEEIEACKKVCADRGLTLRVRPFETE